MGIKKTRFHNGHRWTDDELKKVIRLWSERKTLDEIVDAFGGQTTRAALHKLVLRLRKEGIPLERRNQGHKSGQRAGALWTQPEVEYLARKRMEGATCEDIALGLGRSFLAVQGMIQKLRNEGVPIAMRGQGVRRLWDPDTLRAAMLTSAEENVNVIRLDERANLTRAAE